MPFRCFRSLSLGVFLWQFGILGLVSHFGLLSLLDFLRFGSFEFLSPLCLFVLLIVSCFLDEPFESFTYFGSFVRFVAFECFECFKSFTARMEVRKYPGGAH